MEDKIIKCKNGVVVTIAGHKDLKCERVGNIETITFPKGEVLSFKYASYGTTANDICIKGFMVELLNTTKRGYIKSIYIDSDNDVFIDIELQSVDIDTVESGYVAQFTSIKQVM